ncbi:MAG: signal peptidase II [Dehalococcoidia bacterium]
MKRWLQRVTTARSEAFRRGLARGLPLFLIALSVIGLDQLSKYLIRANMEMGQSIPREGPVGLHYTTNTGGAFGLFANQAFLLSMAAVIGIAVLVLYLRYLPPRSTLLKVGLGLDLGGAIGNLIDRLRLGAVTDFIDIGAWPVFNLADSAIVVGTFLIAFYLLFAARRMAR